MSKVLKWTGSKSFLAEWLYHRFPQHNIYHEPFIGGGSFFEYVRTPVIASDIMPELIAIWNTIKDKPDSLIEYYGNFWNRLNEYSDDRISQVYL